MCDVRTKKSDIIYAYLANRRHINVGLRFTVCTTVNFFTTSWFLSSLVIGDLFELSFGRQRLARALALSSWGLGSISIPG